MTPFMAALLGLGLNEGAYMAEIVRAGIQSVDEGQTEAVARAGHDAARKTMRRVVLPQAMRVIVPPTGNEFINMLKTSSLVSAVQYTELLRATSNIGTTSGAIMEMLFVASIWYLALTSVFSVGQYYLERRYARGSLRDLPPTPFQRSACQPRPCSAARRWRDDRSAHGQGRGRAQVLRRRAHPQGHRPRGRPA